MKTLRLTLLAAVLLTGAKPGAVAASEVSQFVGSSPFGPAIAAMLDLPVSPKTEIIEWKLALTGIDAGKGRYELSYDFGPSVPNLPGLGSVREARTKQGEWDTRAAGRTQVFVLHGALALRAVGPDLLHILNSDGTLMTENGGWNFTLNRVRAADAARPAPVARDVTYEIAPLANGPEVAAVFEGRTPGHEIAVVLGRRELLGALKAKWRVTLYQDPATRQPTTYKVEGSMYRRPRQGRWSLERGATIDPNAIVYALAATPTDGPLLLLAGDDRVAFLLDQQRQPLVGNEHFSYTLHRRK